MGGVNHLYGILVSTDFDALMSDVQLEESKDLTQKEKTKKAKSSKLIKTTVIEPSSTA